MREPPETGLLSRHTHCHHCGEPMHGARFGQRYCSVLCRLDGKAAEAGKAPKDLGASGQAEGEGEEEQCRSASA